MSSPDISVVMGVYNNADTLQAALDSILSQQGVDFEFIVVDDGSTDGTAAILDTTARRDSRLRAVHKRNEGLTRALINGCALAAAPWIARQDADDVSLPGRLKAQRDRARQADVPALVVCASRCRTMAGEMLYENHPPASPVAAAAQILEGGRGLCAHGALFFRREAYEKIGGYRAAFYFAQDIDLVIRLAEQGPVGTVSEVLYEFSYEPGSISGSKYRQQQRFYKMARKSREVRMRGGSDSSLLLELENKREERDRFPGRGRSHFPGLYFIGVALLDRQPDAARRYLRQALFLRPGSLRAWIRWLQAGVAMLEGGANMKPPVFNPEWSELVKALYAHDMQEIWDPALAPHIYNMYRDELRRYFRIAGRQPLRILDVGCAQGTLALLLAEAGHQVVAVDLRPEFLDYARTRYEKGDICFVQGNAMELDLPGPFDLIYANQILEHLVHPVEMVRGLARMLTPSGRLVVTTPNGRYLKSDLPTYGELGDLAPYEARQFFPDGDGHFFAYSPEELRDIFLRAGLAGVSVRPYDSPWITGHMKVRYLHGRVPVSVLRALDRLVLAIPGLRIPLAFQLMVSGRTPA